MYQYSDIYINPFVPNAPFLYPLRTNGLRKQWRLTSTELETQ